MSTMPPYRDTRQCQIVTHRRESSCIRNYGGEHASRPYFFRCSRSFFVNYCVLGKVILFYSTFNFIIIINSTDAGCNKRITTWQKCGDFLCDTFLFQNRECVQVYNAQSVPSFTFVLSLAIVCDTCSVLTLHFQIWAVKENYTAVRHGVSDESRQCWSFIHILIESWFFVDNSCRDVPIFKRNLVFLILNILFFFAFLTATIFLFEFFFVSKSCVLHNVFVIFSSIHATSIFHIIIIKHKCTNWPHFVGFFFSFIETRQTEGHHCISHFQRALQNFSRLKQIFTKRFLAGAHRPCHFSLNGRAEWKLWKLNAKWCCVSERESLC